MRTRKLDEKETAELLSEYVDHLNEGNRDAAEQILAEHPQLTEGELGQVFELSVFIENLLPAPLSIPEKTAHYEHVCECLDDIAQPKEAAQSLAAGGSGKRPDFLIMLLHFAKQVWGKTKLMKLVFLLKQEAHCDRFVHDFYSHVAYDYGPFDDAVRDDVNALTRCRLIQCKPPRHVGRGGDQDVGLEGDEVHAVYTLTEPGKKCAMAIVAEAQKRLPEVVAAVRTIAERYGRMPGEQLLKYVYEQYPKFTENSKIRDRVLGHGVEEQIEDD